MNAGALLADAGRSSVEVPVAYPCRVVSLGVSVDATWQREADQLVISPTQGAPLAMPLGEVNGIEGDGFSIVLHSLQGDLRVERLGADGPTLLQELRRDWPALRARLLRLVDGAEVKKVFKGHARDTLHDGAFTGFLAQDRFVYAIEGSDVRALHLAECQSVRFDERAFCIRCDGWNGDAGAVFSKLGGETAAFFELLRSARGQLTAEADATMARHLPSLAPGARATISAHWLPGRLMGMDELERLAPGFEAAFLASWLAHSHRVEEGRTLMSGVPASGRWLGYGRSGRTLAPQDSGVEHSQLLWMLVRSPAAWSLELLSQGDYATYLFFAEEDVPKLVAGLIQYPEFSREALYLPLTDLIEERARYAVPARELPLLCSLRARFAGRRIHAARERPSS